MSDVVIYKSLDFMGYPKYKIGDDGSFWVRRGDGTKRRPHTWNKIRGVIERQGKNLYVKVGLTNGFDTPIYEYVHRLVLIAFRGPPKEGQVCRHYPNRGPMDNRLCNLVWGTHKENAADRNSQGTHNKGPRNGLAKLSEADVIQIRADYKAWNRGITHFVLEQAEKYEVSEATIRNVIRRKTYDVIA